MISVTMVVEHVFCNRFTYYGMVAGLPQYEQKRGTVDTGKKHHKSSEITNKNYVPKNIVGKKITAQKLYSSKYGFVGIVDHAIITDTDIVIIERKYSSGPTIYDTLRAQLGLLSLLLEENLKKPVKQAIVIFTKDNKRTTVTVPVDENLQNFAINMLNETNKVIAQQTMPDTSYSNRCVDCCYHNICDVGSLNTV